MPGRSATTLDSPIMAFQQKLWDAYLMGAEERYQIWALKIGEKR